MNIHKQGYQFQKEAIMKAWLSIAILLTAAGTSKGRVTRRDVTATCPSMEVKHSIEHGLPFLTDCPPNVYFLLDGSESTPQEEFEAGKQYIVDSVSNLTLQFPQATFGVYLFSNGVVKKISSEQRSTYQVNQALQEVKNWIQPVGGTDIYPALHAVLVDYQLNQGGRSGIVVQLTDGCAKNLDKIQQTTAELCKANINIMTVTLGSAYMNMLTQMSISVRDVRTPILWKEIVACPSILPPKISNAYCSDEVILLDGSDSVKPQEPQLLAYLKYTVSTFSDVTNAIGVVTYGDEVGTVIAPVVNKTVLRERIMTDFELPLTGTGTAAGIDKAAQILTRAQNKTIFLITDGPPLDPAATAASVARAKSQNIQVILVGIGPYISFSQLQTINGNDPYNVFHLDDYLSLYSLNLTGRLCVTQTERGCTNICLNGGTAGPIRDVCSCYCPPEFTGSNCGTPVCSLTCVNGVRSSTGCNCMCNPNYTGERCDVCSINCVNGVRSSTGCGCTCNNGYTGERCDVCSLTCVNGVRSSTGCSCVCNNGYSGDQCDVCSLTCVNGMRSSTGCGCTCNPGYSGDRCEVCSLTCVNGVRSSSGCGCICNNGYSGDRCDVCSLTCVNGVRSSTGCSCICNNGYSGDRCDVCSLTCVNGLRSSTGCGCSCNPGYSGDRCDVCSLTCVNGVRSSSGCSCVCNNGYSGDRCDVCSLTCVNGVRSSTGCSCTCNPGYSGDRCEICSLTCVNGVRSSTGCGCTCNPGYSGDRCDVCSLTCINGVRSSTGCSCVCNSAYSGDRCDACSLTCMNGVRSSSGCGCTCNPGYSGERCDICSLTCVNGVRSSTGCSCVCNNGYSGDRCDVCSVTCVNGVRSNTGCGCVCNNGYSGDRCDICSLTCVNGVRSSTGCSCFCNNGYSGNQCEVCSINCVNGVRSSTGCGCTCNSGYSGDRCDVCSLTCINGVRSSTGCGCTCNPGYSGDRCDVCSLTCVNGVRSNTGCSCVCNNGYSGDRCDVCSLTCANGVRSSTGCGCVCNNGYSGDRCDVCSLTCVNGVRSSTGCSCVCNNGYTGDRCDVCPLTCVNGVRSSTGCSCVCNNGYFGNQCEVCSLTCVNGVRSSTGCGCTCNPGYSGEHCDVPPACTLNCKNNGTRVNEQSAQCSCLCLPEYTGQDCGDRLTCTKTCQNGGVLQAPESAQCYCQCPTNFTGPTCQVSVTLTSCPPSRNPCKNNQPAFEDCHSRCICQCDPKLYRGPYCEISVAETTKLCGDCEMKNGIGFVPMENRCDMFIMCQQGLNNSLISHVINCPDNTFWNQKILTCDHLSNNVQCTTDPCQNLSSNAKYAHYLSCQAYWQCDSNGKTSQQGCCPVGYGFNSTTGSCNPDATCPRTCSSDGTNVTECPATRDAAPAECSLEGSVTDKKVYRHKAFQGTTYSWQKCPTGFIFVDTYSLNTFCGCILDTSASSCEVDTEINFDDPLYGVSIRRDVPGGIGSGVGEFRGSSAYTVWRFSNSGFNFDTFDITARILPENLQPGQEYAVISNGDCGKNASFSISVNQTHAIFLVRNGEGMPVVKAVPYKSGIWVSVELHYRRTKTSSGYQYSFWGVVDGASSDVSVHSGPIELRECGVQIGSGTGLRFYEGLIDEIELWTCLP